MCCIIAKCARLNLEKNEVEYPLSPSQLKAVGSNIEASVLTDNDISSIYIVGDKYVL